MANPSRVAALCLASGAAAVGGCATARPSAAAADLRSDSARYTVRSTGPSYRAAIGYVYTNRTGAPVSANYCQAPTPPVLEKDVGGGQWVVAYRPIRLLCKTHPPFRVAAGATYRGTLDFRAARRGTDTFPEFAVDSVPGTYRLRWTLRAGSDPDAPHAPDVVAVSAPFRLLVEQRR